MSSAWWFGDPRTLQKTTSKPLFFGGLPMILRAGSLEIPILEKRLYRFQLFVFWGVPGLILRGENHRYENHRIHMSRMDLYCMLVNGLHDVKLHIFLKGAMVSYSNIICVTCVIPKHSETSPKQQKSMWFWKFWVSNRLLQSSPTVLAGKTTLQHTKRYFPRPTVWWVAKGLGSRLFHPWKFSVYVGYIPQIGYIYIYQLTITIVK